MQKVNGKQEVTYPHEYLGRSWMLIIFLINGIP